MREREGERENERGGERVSQEREIAQSIERERSWHKVRGEEEYDDQGEENKGILSGKEQNKDERKGKRRGKMRKSYRQRKGSLCDDQDEIDKEVERGRERMNKMERNKRPKDLRIPKKTTASTAYLSRKPETEVERERRK